MSRYKIETLGAARPSMVEWLEAVEMNASRKTAHRNERRRRGWVSEEGDTRAPRPLTPRNLPAGVEGVINRQDWEELKLTPREMREFEERDMAAMQEVTDLKAQGKSKTCPRAEYEVDVADNSIRVRVKVQHSAGHWVRGGSITAYKSDEHQAFIVSSSDTDLALLADCPGLGTGLYERAAKAACKEGSVLAGSDARSAFSERFWARQIKKSRAVCGQGKGYVYNSPLYHLKNQLRDGSVNVPQFNTLVRGLPPPPRSGEWPCGLVRLNDCPAPESLRGLRRRKR